MIAVLRVSYFTLHWNDDKQLTKSSLGAKFSEFFVHFGTQLKALCISENFSFYTLRSSVCMAVMIINAMVPSHVLLSATKRYPSGQANKVVKNNLYIYINVWKKFDKTNNGNDGDAKNDDDDDDDDDEDDSDNDVDDDEDRTRKQTNNSVIHLWRYTVL